MKIHVHMCLQKFVKFSKVQSAGIIMLDYLFCICLVFVISFKMFEMVAIGKIAVSNPLSIN